MPFGRHKGAALEDLPDAYVQWLQGLPDLREPLRSGVEAEWRSRFGPWRRAALLPAEARPIAEELITVGYRQLAQRCHPDVGGSTQTMQRVNLVAEWLRQAVRAA